MAGSGTHLDPISQYREELILAGLQPEEICPDGKIRRCGTQDHPNSRNGWHVLYADPLAGAYGDWANGLSETWSMGGQPLHPDKMHQLREEIIEQKIQREKQKKAEQAAAIKKARAYLKGLLSATDANAYLARKGVKTIPGLLADGANLIVPVMGADGQPISYQRIDPSGGKRFATGCPVAGGWFAIKGNDGPLAICEGVATGISLHQVTGFTVLVAFSAVNLEKVARIAREYYPDRRILLCADDDRKEQDR